MVSVLAVVSDNCQPERFFPCPPMRMRARPAMSLTSGRAFTTSPSPYVPPVTSRRGVFSTRPRSTTKGRASTPPTTPANQGRVVQIPGRGVQIQGRRVQDRARLRATRARFRATRAPPPAPPLAPPPATSAGPYCARSSSGFVALVWPCKAIPLRPSAVAFWC